MGTCPICRREHAEKTYTCACGYQRLRAYAEEDTPFEIYKFSKAIFYKKCAWEASPLDAAEENGKLIVHESLERERAVSLVAPRSELPTETRGGILPFMPQVVSLLIDTDAVDWLLLDESNVQMLFLGARVKQIEGGNFTLYSRVKYIEVAADNPCFCAENNVLFDKDKRTLLNYARMKKETEYTIPDSVRTVCAKAFFACENLKIVHASKKTRFSPHAFEACGDVRVVYDA